jgi:hypothetical protein
MLVWFAGELRKQWLAEELTASRQVICSVTGGRTGLEGTDTPAFGNEQDQMGDLASLHSVLYFETDVNKIPLNYIHLPP